MGSLDRNVKDKQLEMAIASFEAHKAKLTAKGLDEKASLKDPTYKALKAKVKKARSRIRSIDAIDAHVKAMAEKETRAKSEKAKAAEKAKAKAAKGGKKQAKPAKKKK